MSPFNQSPAALKLHELAKRAPHLTDASFLTEERLANKRCEAAGWTLHWGTQRVDAEIEGALHELASERGAVASMRAMQSGAIVNKIEGSSCENRPALHTALRAQAPLPEGVAEQARRVARAELEKIRAFLAETEGEFSDLLVIGIGGSELGPKALYLGLKAFTRSGRALHFVSSLDPDEIHLALASCTLERTLVLSISKSGTTLETQTNETILRGALRAKGLDDRRHIASISMPNTPLDDATRYRAHFTVEETIGGRVSSTSAIGAAIIGFMIGSDAFEEILRGASKMDQIACSDDLKSNLPLRLALLGIWNRNFLNHSHLAIIPYSQALARFSAHLQQLDMESNGKQIDKAGHRVAFATGPLIWGEPGTNAQHSIGQWLHQGTDICPLEFIGCLAPQRGPDFPVNGSTSGQKLLCNLFAQALALAQGQNSENPNRHFAGNRPSAILLTPQLTGETLGALWALYEHKVAFQGFLWNINSFDQEGVQLGKVLATRFVDAVKGRQEGRSIEPVIGRCWLESIAQ